MLIGVAAALRFWSLGDAPLWLDEHFSLLVATSPHGVVHELRSDVHPPLYFLVLKAWTWVFGASAWWARALSTLFGLTFLVTLAGCLRSFSLGHRAVLWSVLLGTVSPLQICHSQQVRGYTLLATLACLALWTLRVAVQRGQPRYWALHGAALLAGLYTHNVFVGVLVSLWVVFASVQKDKRSRPAFLVTHVCAIALWLPWVIGTWPQDAELRLKWVIPFWEATPPALAILRSLELFGIGGQTPPYLGTFANIGHVGIRILSAAWFTIVILAGVFERPRATRGGAAPEFADWGYRCWALQ